MFGVFLFLFAVVFQVSSGSLLYKIYVCTPFVLQMESDEDVLWVPDVRETFESLAERGMKFIEW